MKDAIPAEKMEAYGKDVVAKANAAGKELRAAAQNFRPQWGPHGTNRDAWRTRNGV